MFECVVSDVADLPGRDDAGVVDAIRELTRAENAICARKLAAMAELFRRRTGLEDAGDRDMWWVDPDAAVAAEIGAAGGISQGLALSQAHRGVALTDRLPAIAALFAAGEISDLLVRTIVWRTALVDSPDAMAALDLRLAERVTRWGALSEKKTEQAIDELVDQIDPGGLRRSRSCGSRRGVQFGSPGDEPGFMTMWARVYAVDGVAIQSRVEEMSRGVCEADPRSADERRADALAAAIYNTAFACQCGEPDCTKAQSAKRPSKTAVVYVVADEKSVEAARYVAVGAAPDQRTAPASGTAVHSADTASQCTAPPAYLFGAGIMPTALLGATLARATIREVRHPGGDSPPDPRYAPTREMREFVRCRDLTCRFPFCDEPAQFCEVDHTVPYPVGPTHPSNLKCVCGLHHLVKTFWNGSEGWRDRQLPDGTIIWTAPTGHTYTTYPGSKHLFPTLCEPTATLWTGQPPTIQPSGDRGLMMPRRRYTRAHNKAKAIAAERRLNDSYTAEVLAERNKPPPF